MNEIEKILLDSKDESELWEVIVKYNGDIFIVAEEVNGTVEILSETYAIMNIKASEIRRLPYFSQVEYVEVPKTITLLYDGVSNKEIPRMGRSQKTIKKPQYTQSVKAQEFIPNKVSLTGKGVLIGIIDSGINFRHEAFITDEGESRIEFMWDQTSHQQGYNPPPEFNYGSEYTNQEITEAIQGMREIDEIDTIGHGTAVAGVAAGSSNLYRGIATDARLLIVKLGDKGRGSFSRTTELMRAIKYVHDKAVLLNRPLVINISFGTNDGGHDGRSLFETYIDDMASKWKTNIIIPTGNDANNGHHFFDKMRSYETLNINFVVANGIEKFSITLWKSFVDIMEFEVISPSGFSTGTINYSTPIMDSKLGDTNVRTIYGEPKPYNDSQEIFFDFSNKNSGKVAEGIWLIRINAKIVVEGNVNLWLPVNEVVSGKTTFSAPSPKTTLTIPATAARAITVAGYNPVYESISSFSGKGFDRNNIVKPDISAPAENVYSTTKSGGYDNFTGTSFAAPNVAGICALFMEWGIVERNDFFLYGERMKAYLQLGALRKNNLSYPNPDWGYGIVTFDNTFKYLQLQQNPFSEDLLFTKQDVVTTTESTKPLEVKNKIQKQNVFEIIHDIGKPHSQAELSLFQENIKNYQFNKVNTMQNNEDNTEVNEIITDLPQSNLDDETQTFNSSPSISNEYFDIILQNTEENVKILSQIDYIELYPNAVENYIMAYIPIIKRDEFMATVFNKIVTERAFILTTMDLDAMDKAGILPVLEQPDLALDGSGVLVGIIDTGIDYTKENFIYEDGTSKIKYIWDQSIEGNAPEDFYYGTEFTNDQINHALENPNPQSVVPHVDEIGHGTFVSSVAAGRRVGNVIGAAPLSDLVVVKLKNAKQPLVEDELISRTSAPKFQSNDVMLAVEYLYKKSKELKMPISIYIGLGTNSGSHDGTSFFESYLSDMSRKNRMTLSIAAGNEGNARTHFYGRLKTTGDELKAEINVGNNEEGFVVDFWIGIVDKVSVSIMTPTGAIINRLAPVNWRTYEERFVFEKSVVYVTYEIFFAKTNAERIKIKLVSPTAGIWSITLHGDYIVDGRIHGWLPLRNFLEKETVFLIPNNNYTVTVPSTALYCIAVGAYDHRKNSLYVYTSFGPSRRDAITVSFVAPGVFVEGTYPYGNGVMTGSSVSTAITAGACALLLQWGIVYGNDYTINSTTARGYIAKGCNRRKDLDYPNIEWGYGTMDLYESFQSLQDNYYMFGDYDINEDLF